MIYDLHVCDTAVCLKDAQTLVICGRLASLKKRGWVTSISQSARLHVDHILDTIKMSDAGASGSSYVPEDEKVIHVIAVPDVASRHNHPMHPNAMTTCLRATNGSKKRSVLMVLDRAEDDLVCANAMARSLPSFSRKTGVSDRQETVRLGFLGADVSAERLEVLQITAEEVRFAARLVDMPTTELHTESFTELARQSATMLGADVSVLEGEALAHAGLGGLWGVGRAATRLPALVILEHTPTQPRAETRTIALVGKGIVYDTGGLSIKSKTGMPGMKADMGGAAAVLGAFRSLVRRNAHHRVIALLCLAENSVGPEATRPDDILTMYSGKTVEVNNTDAEGRLVVADGVAYAQRHFKPDFIIDIATLTGAQLVATGARHGAIVTNNEDLESLTTEIGRNCGDLVHPLPYCPEFFRGEFKSTVADMRNSVKSRMNAQSSCAAQFIAEHLLDFEGAWLHLDIAGPSTDTERGTGFGMTLLTELTLALE